MTISKLQLQSILDTLPIGYYLKHDIDVQIDESAETSYIDIFNQQIFISIKGINNMLQNVNSVSHDDLERYVRTCLYHELSHAILTNKHTNARDYMNIFEDERIETVFRNYYKKVDFKKFIKEYADYEPNHVSTSALDLFFYIVRFDEGPKQFIDRKYQLIQEYYCLNRNSDRWTVDDYNYDVAMFYKDVQNFFASSQNEVTQNELNTNQSNLGNNQNNVINNQFDSNDSQDDTANNQNNISDEALQSAIDSSLSLLDTFNDKSIINEVSKILLSRKNFSKVNSSAINSYSGIFNARSVTRTDYKYFVQQNRAGHIKQYSNLHLNLFIDCSGSFKDNELTVNKLLFALKHAERINKDFTFTLITCGVGEKIVDNDTPLHCSGCNHLDNDIFDIFKKVQQPNSNNYNIVLFDGYAFSYLSSRDAVLQHHNFSAFDTRNTTIISESSNTSAISKYVHNAKVIITNNYTKNLLENVYSVLKCI